MNAPEGDIRNWDEIDAWADNFARRWQPPEARLLRRTPILREVS